MQVTDAAIKKTKKGKCEGFLKAIYNKTDHTFLGRSAKGWGALGLYYTIFYAGVCCLFAICLSVFLYFIVKDTEPYRSGAHSLLVLVAGTNVYPRQSIDSALVVISPNPRDQQYIDYSIAANAILTSTFNNSSPNAVNCPTDGDQPDDISKFCLFTQDQLGPCSDPIGQMQQKKLCLYIRVNKVFGWLPMVHKNTSSSDILVNCRGQNAGDVFALGKPVYYPSRAINSDTYGAIGTRFFPYINQSGYASPMAAVQFPTMKPNVAILIQCQIVNLDNSFSNVKLEIMIYDKKTL